LTIEKCEVHGTSHAATLDESIVTAGGDKLEVLWGLGCIELSVD